LGWAPLPAAPLRAILLCRAASAIRLRLSPRRLRWPRSAPSAIPFSPTSWSSVLSTAATCRQPRLGPGLAVSTLRRRPKAARTCARTSQQRLCIPLKELGKLPTAPSRFCRPRRRRRRLRVRGCAARRRGERLRRRQGLRPRQGLHPSQRHPGQRHPRQRRRRKAAATARPCWLPARSRICQKVLVLRYLPCPRPARLARNGATPDR
jgi:hypothetical protein